MSFVSLTFSWDDLFYSIRAKNVILAQFRSASLSTMSSDCTQGIACDKFSPARLWLRKIAAPSNKISLISKNRSAFFFRVYIVSDLTGRKIMPKKESGTQSRKRRAQFEGFLNESTILKVVAMQKDNRPIYEDKTNLLVQIIIEL